MSRQFRGFEVEAKPISKGTRTYEAAKDGREYAIKQF